VMGAIGAPGAGRARNDTVLQAELGRGSISSMHAGNKNAD
jgi:hypothetical protein